MLGGFERAALVSLMLVLMTGIGASLSSEALRAALRRPRGVLVGLVAQYGVMPALALGLTFTLGLEPSLALGFIILGTCPGGGTASLFTYLARGDVALALALNVVSAVVSLVAAPALLAVYVATVAPSDLVAPIGPIALAIASTIVPVLGGLVLRRRRPTWARAVERAGTIAGVTIVLLLVVTGVVRNAAVFLLIPWQGYVAAVVLGAAGMLLGYASGRLARLAPWERLAIAFGTGVQNGPRAIGIIVLSFPADVADIVLRLPMLYALFLILQASAVVAIVSWRRRGTPTSVADPRA